MKPAKIVPHPAGRPTVVSILTVAGDMLTISLSLLVLSIGVVTAGPGLAGALEARSHVSRLGPSQPLATVFSGVPAQFRRSWFVGPTALILGAVAWVSIAFWLAADSPMAIIAIGATVFVAGTAGLLLLAWPRASASENGATPFRSTLRLIASRPLHSVVALAALVTCGVLTVLLPTIAIVTLGAAVTEIVWRAWYAPLRHG
ncbi:MAG: hypothetical protein ABI067_14665 [Leifsonia sp.]